MQVEVRTVSSLNGNDVEEIRRVLMALVQQLNIQLAEAERRITELEESIEP